MTINENTLDYVHIKQNRIIVNGSLVYEDPNVSANEFLLKAYQEFDIQYPKFFKMDDFCRIGFLAAELLLRKQTIAGLKPEEVGITISTSNSSLDTDVKYYQTVNDVPSPALFVYTLPNILTGELCIRHKIKGETSCFVFDIFDLQAQQQYVDMLFAERKIKACLSGWTDFFQGKGEAFFYLRRI